MDGGSLYNAVLISNKKKHASNPSHSMDEPQTYSKWSQIQKTTYYLAPFWRMQNHTDGKQISGGRGFGWEERLTSKHLGRCFWMIELFYISIFILLMVSWLCVFVKTHRIVTLRDWGLLYINFNLKNVNIYYGVLWDIIRVLMVNG